MIAQYMSECVNAIKDSAFLLTVLLECVQFIETYKKDFKEIQLSKYKIIEI